MIKISKLKEAIWFIERSLSFNNFVSPGEIDAVFDFDDDDEDKADESALRVNAEGKI